MAHHAHMRKGLTNKNPCSVIQLGFWNFPFEKNLSRREESPCPITPWSFIPFSYQATNHEGSFYQEKVALNKQKEKRRLLHPKRLLDQLHIDNLLQKSMVLSPIPVGVQKVKQALDHSEIDLAWFSMQTTSCGLIFHITASICSDVSLEKHHLNHLLDNGSRTMNSLENESQSYFL